MGAETTEEIVLEAVGHQFPLLYPKRAVRLPAGEFQAWEIDRETVFRFAIDDEGSAKLRREVDLLSRIGSALPVRVPEIEFAGHPGESYRFAFNGYRKIKGRSGEVAGAVGTPVARQAGKFLSTLHSIPPRLAQAAKMPRMAAWSADVAAGVLGWAGEAALPWVPDQIRERVDGFLHDAVMAPPDGAVENVIVNADLKGEHVLISPDGGRITGILDWADACVSDPMVDFMGLISWLGPEFAWEVLGHYRRPVDPDFFVRAVYWARCFALDDVAQRVQGRSDVPLKVLQARLVRAFSGES